MRFVTATNRVISALALLLAMGWASQAHAQLAVGTWARTDLASVAMTMTVEVCCNGGRRLTYHVPAMGGQPAATMTVDSPMNGTDVPMLVNGKPSGQTMAIKRVDDHHFSTVVKMNGQTYGTSSTTISADGKSATTESISQTPGGTPKKTLETWVKK
jgi:hypothetical protein